MSVKKCFFLFILIIITTAFFTSCKPPNVNTYPEPKEEIPIETPVYNITLSAINGSIRISPELDSYQEGTTITLKALPSYGFDFVHWTGSYTGQENPITMTVERDIIFIATFQEKSPPQKPTDIVADLISPERLILSWKDNAEGESRYIIERGINGIDYNQIALIP